MNRRGGSLVRQQGRQTQELEQQDSFISQTDSTNNQSALTTRLESALQHLQPIRDLAQNWDVDIASCLEDVLNELAAEHQFSQQQWATDESAFSQSFHSQQSQQHHHATIAAHFSQAAILLQNAGFVYSRKVEYLYNLVFQAMKDLSNSNLSDNSAAPKSARKGAAITSLEDFDNFDPECNFELMDDVIPIAPLKNGHRPAIDLEEDDQVAGGLDTDESTYAITRRQLDLTTANVTNLSLGGLSTSRRIDQTNKSMLDDRTKCFQSRNFATQSTATRMEKLMRDLLLKGSSSGSGVQLRLTQGGCDIDAQGILVMPGANVLEFDHFLNVMDKEECHGFGSTRSHTNPTPKPQQPEPMECSPPRNSPLAYNDEMDDGDDEDPGFAFAGDSPMRQDYISENAISKSPSNNPPPLKPEPDPPIKKNDPWMLLDALDSGGTKPRPLKKGRTIRLPLGIQEKPSLCVTGASTRDDKKAKAAASRARKALKDHQERIQQEHIWRTMGGYTTHVLDITLDEDGKVQLQPLMYHQFSNSSQRDAHLQIMTNTLLSLKGLAYGKEFAYIAKATAERRTQEKRKERLKRAQESVANPQPPAQTHAYHDDYDEDDNDEGGFGYAGVDDNNDDHNDDFDQTDNADFPTASYNMPIHTQDVNDYQNEKDTDLFLLDQQTFQDLCRAHISKFAKGAEKYAAHTKLSKRVDDWQSRLAPILEEEEERPEFNIQQYGNRILTALQQDKASQKENLRAPKGKQASAFTSNFGCVLAPSCEKYEVCRLFLSSLMLCDSGNIRFGNCTENDESCRVISSRDAFQIMLLKHEYNQPSMSYEKEEYY